MFINKRNFLFLLIILFVLAFIYYVFLPMLTETFIQEGIKSRGVKKILSGAERGLVGVFVNGIKEIKQVKQNENASGILNSIANVFKL